MHFLSSVFTVGSLVGNKDLGAQAVIGLWDM